MKDIIIRVSSQGKNQRVITVPKQYWDKFPVGKLVKLIPISKMVPIEEK